MPNILVKGFLNVPLAGILINSKNLESKYKIMRAMSCRNGDKLIHQIYAWISNWEIGSNGSNISGLERDYFFLQLSHDSYEIMNIT